MVNNIADRIRKERENRKLTQAQMAEQLKIAQSAYNRIERGDTDITVSRLSAIAEILNLDLNHFINEPQPSVSSANIGQSNNLLEIKHSVLKEQLFQLLKLYALPYIQHRWIKGNDNDKAQVKEVLLKKLPYLSHIKILLQNSIISKEELESNVEEYIEWFYKMNSVE